jgi:hypothetical protein
MYYFSPTTMGFYHSTVHQVIPSDAFEVADHEHAEIFSQLATGKELKYDDGKIVTVEKKSSLTWQNIRAKRDKLLAACDYTQLPDYPNNNAAWVEYRQALRDIPVKFNDPNVVVWPTKPV